MNPLFKNLIGVGVFVAAISITLFMLFSGLSERSFYKTSGNISLSGINDTVSIIIDNYGVPAIEAGNEEDMYFALGYMHAQDRLWQMDLTRRVAEGRLAEIFGKDVIEFDVLFRTLGIYKIAYQLYDSISPKSKEILQSYSLGVNSFIRSNIKNLPFEFDVLDYKPDPWKPEHSLMIVRLMAWDLNFSWYKEYLFSELAVRFGDALAKDFIPDYSPTGPFVIKSKIDSKPTTDTNSVSSADVPFDNTNLALANGFLERVISYRDYFGASSTGQGSNAWVVSSNKSDNGKPLLANDPHLELTAPSKWYEAKISNKSSGKFAAGFTIPGTPGVVAGRNNSIAWGVTNLMNDDSDLITFNRVSPGSSDYLYKGTAYALDSTVEEIKIKDEVDGYFFVSYHSIEGPVVSGLNKIGFSSQKNIPDDESKILVLKWTGFYQSDEVFSFYNLNNAENWSQFRNSFKKYNAPSLNFVYADTSGNIGYQAAGYIPVRQQRTSVIDAYYPTSSQVEWSGFIPFDKLPHIQNPDTGFIVSANNPPLKDAGYYISYLYEPHYRAERIEDVISSRSLFSAEEFELLQNDVYSLQAKEFLSYLFEAAKDSTGIESEYKEYLDLMKNWDYQMLSSSVQTTIFAAFELMLYKNIYRIRFGEDLFRDYIFVKNIPVRNTSKLLRQGQSWLFNIDPVSVIPVPPNDILKLSFYEAIDKLIEVSGTTNYDLWAWSEFHKVIIRHPLGSVPALANVLNIGPFGIGGSGTTIMSSEYRLFPSYQNFQFESTLGSSMRMVIDLSDDSKMITINSTGQSGQPLHPHYKDQSRLWLFAEYKTFDFNPVTPQPAGSTSLITLIPSN